MTNSSFPFGVPNHNFTAQNLPAEEGLRIAQWQIVQCKEVLAALLYELTAAGGRCDTQLSLAVTACLTDQPVVFSADAYLAQQERAAEEYHCGIIDPSGSSRDIRRFKP